VIRRRTRGSPFPNYELYLEQPNQKPRFVMNARKVGTSRTTLYRMSFEKNNYNNEHLVGRVRANFIGTTFTVTDNGRNPFKSRLLGGGGGDDDDDDASAPSRPVRSEFACITYVRA